MGSSNAGMDHQNRFPMPGDMEGECGHGGGGSMINRDFLLRRVSWDCVGVICGVMCDSLTRVDHQNRFVKPGGMGIEYNSVRVGFFLIFDFFVGLIG